MSAGLYEGTLGARYVLVRAHNRELLEIKVAPNSMVLQSFILVLSNNAPTGGFQSDFPGEAGLPILKLPNEIDFPEQASIAEDIKLPIALCKPARHADIRIGTAATFDRCLSHGRVRFLILGDELVGLRVADLTDEGRAGLEDYIARQVLP